MYACAREGGGSGKRERGREEGKENNVFFLVMRIFKIAWSLTAGTDGIHGDFEGMSCCS